MKGKMLVTTMTTSVVLLIGMGSSAYADTSNTANLNFVFHSQTSEYDIQTIYNDFKSQMKAAANTNNKKTEYAATVKAQAAVSRELAVVKKDEPTDKYLKDAKQNLLTSLLELRQYFGYVYTGVSGSGSDVYVHKSNFEMEQVNTHLSNYNDDIAAYQNGHK